MAKDQNPKRDRQGGEAAGAEENRLVAERRAKLHEWKQAGQAFPNDFRPNASAAELVVDASPARLDRLLDVRLPVVRVGYRFQQVSGRPLFEFVEECL